MSTTRKSILSLLSFLLILSSSIRVMAKPFEYEKKKEVKRSFSVGPNDLLQVDNRFGNIFITHWTKNEVDITVVVETKANNERRAQADLDRIQISLNQSGSRLSAITSLKDSRGDNENKGEDNRLTINYYINIPAKLTIDLTQKYGNMTLPNINPGKCSLHSKFGNINAGNFTGDLSVEAKYGNVDLGSVERATFDLGYVESALIKEAKKLTMDSKYSNLALGAVQELELESKYGNTTIQCVDKARLSVRYGEATIGLVKKELSVDDLSYSSLTVKELSANFIGVDVSARFGNLHLSVPSSAAFNVKAEGMKYGKFNLEGFQVTRSEKDDKTNSYAEVNKGAERTIRFEGNDFSNLIIKAL